MSIPENEIVAETALQRATGRNERENRRKNLLRQKNRVVVAEMKQCRGCDLCGRRDLPTSKLDYHHKSRAFRLRKISHMLSSSTSALIEETRKCHLWCGAAHRRFHATGEVSLCKEAFSGVISANGGGK